MTAPRKKSGAGAKRTGNAPPGEPGENPVRVEVAVAAPVLRTYTYRVPPEMAGRAETGRRVVVPFGPRRVTGYVMGPAEPDDSVRLKDVLHFPDDGPIFPPDMAPLFRWLAEYYIHPIGDVVTGALPDGLTLRERPEYRATPAGIEALSSPDTPEAWRPILQSIADGRSTVPEIARDTGGSVSVGILGRMLKNGWLEKALKVTGKKSAHKKEKLLRVLRTDVSLDRHLEKRLSALSALENMGEVPAAYFRKIAPDKAGLLPFLIREGFVGVREVEVSRSLMGEDVAPDTPPDLTPAQKELVDAVAAVPPGAFTPFMLSGVTGSGKTEVYLHLAARTLARGKSVLVLVPEIALISQIEARFKARFGPGVAVLHSGLTPAQRLSQWLEVLRGEVPIAIGARSAVFSPLPDLGLIVVDEEHDESFKQETGLKYNARDVAVVRAQQCGCPVLLASATPSIQSWHNAQTGKYRALVLPERIRQRPMASVSVVDLRQFKELRGVHRIITPPLRKAVTAVLERREQALLFLNRRGFSNLPVCAVCGAALKCDRCDISLTLHKKSNAFKCHYCGHIRSAASRCGTCGSASLMHTGMGTERVEAAAAALFPDARIARMDRDTTTRKGSLVRMLKALRDREIDLLVGTQMVAKGHDFPNITLVGVILADLSLNFPDFRAAERTFQLLAQVAGRAGRGESPGRVVLQTYNPDHYSVATARDQDFPAFFDQEAAQRRELSYPPFARLVQVRIQGPNPDSARDRAVAVGEALREAAAACGPGMGEVLGPVEAPLHRLADRYRWQILLKARSAALLNRLVRAAMSLRPEAFRPPDAHVAVDVDPFSMM